MAIPLRIAQRQFLTHNQFFINCHNHPLLLLPLQRNNFTNLQLKPHSSYFSATAHSTSHSNHSPSSAPHQHDAHKCNDSHDHSHEQHSHDEHTHEEKENPEEEELKQRMELPYAPDSEKEYSLFHRMKRYPILAALSLCGVYFLLFPPDEIKIFSSKPPSPKKVEEYLRREILNHQEDIHFLVPAYWNYSKSLEEQGKLQEAEEALHWFEKNPHFQKAKEKFEQDPLRFISEAAYYGVHFRLGAFYYNHQQWEKAQEHLQEALAEMGKQKLVPQKDRQDTHLLLASVYEKLGNLGEAQTYRDLAQQQRSILNQ